MGNKRRLKGWLGDTNNVGAYACGVGRVVQVNKAGDRARVVVLEGVDLAKALEQLGHPDIDGAPEMPEASALDDGDAYEHTGDSVEIEGTTYAVDTDEEIEAVALLLTERGIDSVPVYRGACPDRIKTSLVIVAR
jgi:hypothetical protein